MRLTSPYKVVCSALLLAGLAAAPAFAQSAMETPAASPKAKAEQRVGITDFSIEYSSPAVKGRTIWGELVPFDTLWRTGANMATKLTAAATSRSAASWSRPAATRFSRSRARPAGP